MGSSGSLLCRLKPEAAETEAACCGSSCYPLYFCFSCFHTMPQQQRELPESYRCSIGDDLSCSVHNRRRCESHTDNSICSHGFRFTDHSHSGDVTSFCQHFRIAFDFSAGDVLNPASRSRRCSWTALRFPLPCPERRSLCPAHNLKLKKNHFLFLHTYIGYTRIYSDYILFRTE